MTTNITRFTIEAQGSRVSLGRNGTVSRSQKQKEATRGKVTEFSDRSRSRLLRLTASMDKDLIAKSRVIFITLTYGQMYPTSDYAKIHIQTLIKRLRRFAPECSGLWRVELQKRGAPHFHLLVFGLPYLDKAVLAAAWGAVIGQEFWDTSTIARLGAASPPFTRIELIHNHRKAFFYVSKYVAKVEKLVMVTSPVTVKSKDGYLVDMGTGEIVGGTDDDLSIGTDVLRSTEAQGQGSAAALAASGFINVPYLTVANEVLPEVLPQGWQGRHWGVFNRAGLPMAKLVSMVVDVEPENIEPLERAFFQFRRGMAKKWSAANKFGRGKGATIFAWDASYRWFELFEFYLLQELSQQMILQE